MDHPTMPPAANEHQALDQVPEADDHMQTEDNPHAPGHPTMATTAMAAVDSRGKKRTHEEMKNDDSAPAGIKQLSMPTPRSKLYGRVMLNSDRTKYVCLRCGIERCTTSMNTHVARNDCGAPASAHQCAQPSDAD